MKAKHIAASLLFVGVAELAQAASFTSGNLVVSRIGDGSTTLGNSAAPVSILEIGKTGTLAQTITFPTSGANQVTDSGSAASNGYINSYAGYLAMPGYNSAAATASVASTNTKVGTILGSDGNVSTRALLPTGGPAGTPPSPFSGNNFRSIIPTGSNTFYATGTATGSPNTGGAWYYDGTAFTQVSSTAAGQPTNLRNVEIYGGQLFVSSSSSTFLGISSIGAGLPSTSGQTVSLVINTGASSSPYGFVMFDTNSDTVLDTAFIADDRNVGLGTAAGLSKWLYNGSSWSMSYSLVLNTSNNTLVAPSASSTNIVSLRGLTGEYDPVTGFSLYGTTNETSNNRLVQIADSGATPGTWTQLATAGANNVFRGVDLVPAAAAIPEPSSFAALAGLAALGLGAARRRRA